MWSNFRQLRSLLSALPSPWAVTSRATSHRLCHFAEGGDDLSGQPFRPVAELWSLRHEVEEHEAERNESAETIGNSCGGYGDPVVRWPRLKEMSNLASRSNMTVPLVSARRSVRSGRSLF